MCACQIRPVPRARRSAPCGTVRGDPCGRRHASDDARGRHRHLRGTVPSCGQPNPIGAAVMNGIRRRCPSARTLANRDLRRTGWSVAPDADPRRRFQRRLAISLRRLARRSHRRGRRDHGLGRPRRRSGRRSTRRRCGHRGNRWRGRIGSRCGRRLGCRGRALHRTTRRKQIEGIDVRVGTAHAHTQMHVRDRVLRIAGRPGIRDDVSLQHRLAAMDT
jgi:hypothetical protein